MKVNNSPTPQTLENQIEKKPSTANLTEQPSSSNVSNVANSDVNVDLKSRLSEQVTKSRESFESQNTQNKITQSLNKITASQMIVSRKDVEFAKQLAKSFPPKQSLADMIQSGITRSRRLESNTKAFSRATVSATSTVSTASAVRSSTISNKEFLNGTKEFRAALGQVKNLETQLKQLESQGAPATEIAKVRTQFQTAENQLRSRYGYTASTAPKPGAVWVDPQFMSPELNNGQINSSKFPIKTPVLTPPNPSELLFKNGKSVTFTGENGQNITVKSLDEYKTLVANKRAQLGMPVTGGEPVGVHLALEGGGGKGKRYNPAYSAMFEIGVVPTSISGTSAGSIAAALIAAGGDPKTADDFAKDERLKKLFDFGADIDGGLFNGKAAYDLFDQKLREITGIKDRPVTFADLPIPCQIITTKYNDSQLPAGKEDLSKVENRVFVFSQETTPNTPVALAVRASMGIPGLYDSVQMIDPATGREVELVDGGVLDNLPIGYNKNNLPTVALNLTEANGNNPKNNQGQPKALQSGQLKPSNAISSGLIALNMMKAAAGGARDFRESLNPAPNTFVLSLPTWNLENFKQANSTLGFGYDKNLDPVLDKQTRAVTQSFFRDFLDDLKKPGAKGSNLKTPPTNITFDKSLQLNGKTYRATYAGGDRVNFTSNTGQQYSVSIGKDQLENWFCDDLAFGDLTSRLKMALNDYLN